MPTLVERLNEPPADCLGALIAESEQYGVIITADLDYPRLIALEQGDRPGVILFRGGAYSDREMLGLLDRVLARASTLDLDHSIVVVDRNPINDSAQLSHARSDNSFLLLSSSSSGHH